MSAVLYADPAVLWARVLARTVIDDDGCWLWQGAATSRGYGCICSGKRSKSITTHRLAVIVRDGSIPEGMTVDHTCHDSETCRLDAQCPHRRCVNPDHLAVVPLGDNVRRQWESGRCKKGHLLREKRRGDKTVRYCAECVSILRRKENGNTSSDYWKRWREMRPPPPDSPRPPQPPIPPRGGRGATPRTVHRQGDSHDRHSHSRAGCPARREA